MIKKVSSETALMIKGQTFVLVWDENFEGASSCDKCALKDVICKEERDSSLVHLCEHIQSEPDTFFVEI